MKRAINLIYIKQEKNLMYLTVAFEHLVGLDSEFFNLRVEERSRIDSNYSWFNCFASASLIFVLCLRWTFSQCYSIAYCSSTAFILMRTESINPYHTAFSVWKCLPLSKQSTSINGAETLNGYVWRSQFWWWLLTLVASSRSYEIVILSLNHIF